MTPQEVLDAIVEALKQSSAFSGGDYVTGEVDLDGPNNRLQQPFVSLQPVASVRSDPHNTDLIGYTTDDQGNQTGRIFEAVFEMDVQLDIYVAVGNTALDATVLGADLQRALLPYDESHANRPLPNGSGGTITEYHRMRVGEGRRNDDLAAPGIRRWRQDLDVEFAERTTTDEDYVETVETPTDGDISTGDDDDVAIELTVS